MGKSDSQGPAGRREVAEDHKKLRLDRSVWPFTDELGRAIS